MNNHAVSDKNYKHNFNVWKSFKMNFMKDHHDIYLKVDVLLLACVFETFRKESMNSFELDSFWYLYFPGYSWDAMLTFKNINLKLISNTEKYQFIEITIRGGISMICKSYAEANYNFLKSYVTNKPTSYVLFLNTSSLYKHSTMRIFQL